MRREWSVGRALIALSRLDCDQKILEIPIAFLGKERERRMVGGEGAHCSLQTGQ